MFKQIFPIQQKLKTVYFDDVAFEVPENISVAAAAMQVGINSTRVNHHSEERAPFCHIGICHECLMEINGKPNQQACLTLVQDGLRVRRQISVPDYTMLKDADFNNTLSHNIAKGE